jgi:two-component system chemotaxis response regulator CheY
MIVDDIPFMRNLLASILVIGGYAVVAEAASGQEAIEGFWQHRPYLTLMDVAMPGMGGVEAARQIVEADGEARIILCGTFDPEELADYARLPGVQGLITKPFREEQCWWFFRVWRKLFLQLTLSAI